MSFRVYTTVMPEQRDAVGALTQILRFTHWQQIGRELLDTLGFGIGLRDEDIAIVCDIDESGIIEVSHKFGNGKACGRNRRFPFRPTDDLTIIFYRWGGKWRRKGVG
jgi:hypothetical protein